MAVFELKNFVPGSYSLQLLDARGAVVLVKKLTPGSAPVLMAGLAGGALFQALFLKRQLSLPVSMMSQ